MLTFTNYTKNFQPTWSVVLTRMHCSSRSATWTGSKFSADDVIVESPRGRIVPTLDDILETNFDKNPILVEKKLN